MIIGRYNEIFLKGKNKPKFEQKLKQNIQKKLKQKNIQAKTEIKRNRIFIHTNQDCKFLQKTFGIANYSKTQPVKAKIPQIRKQAQKTVKNKKYKTFAIDTKRVTKTTNFTSLDTNEEAGSAIQEKNPNKEVDLDNPELTVGIEIIEDNAYFFTQKIQAPGGLPVGTANKILVNTDTPHSLLAALLMMKRGCTITLTGKNKPNLEKLKEYYPEKNIEFQTKNKDKTLEEIFEETQETKAIVTGYEKLSKYKEKNQEINKPLIDPTIGLTKEEIQKQKNHYL